MSDLELLVVARTRGSRKSSDDVLLLFNPRLVGNKVIVPASCILKPINRGTVLILTESLRVKTTSKLTNERNMFEPLELTVHNPQGG